MSDDVDLGTILSRLKETGAAVMVAGDVPADLHLRACRTLMGTDEPRPRRRVLVVGGTDPTSARDRLPESARTDADHLRVVPDGRPTRSAGAGAAAGSGSSVPTMEPAEATLAEVSATMAEAVDALEPDGGFDPAELRVGVDSLSALSYADDPESVATFLHLFGGLLDEKRGIGNVHLPVERTDPTVDRYAPLFDVVVELRVAGDQPQQRWSVVDGPTSEWLPL